MRCVPLRRAFLRGAENNRALECAAPCPAGAAPRASSALGQVGTRCDAGCRAKSSSREVKFENLGWAADEEMRAAD